MSKTALSTKQRFTEKELAKYWGVTKSTLQKWRTSGTGPIYIKIGGRVIYPKAYVLEYEKNRIFQGTAQRLCEQQ